MRKNMKKIQLWKAFTIFELWKPTWPTSIEAVFFKLDHGV